MLSAMFVLLGGCWQENLPQIDLQGKVVLPREAATRQIPVLDAEGELTYDGDGNVITEEWVDTRLIGPVYLGAYSGIDTVSFDFPHPKMGPIITADTPGDTFPYGGTTVGRIDFACYEALACKVSTGRFTDYASILEYFQKIGNPVVDYRGEAVDSASTFQQYCFDYFYYTSDEEMSFIGDLDFTEREDGSFEADFYMAQVSYVEGLSLWGFMDAPDILATQPEEESTFDSCYLELGGRLVNDYDQAYYEGGPYNDVLNFPATYVQENDFVSEGVVVTNPDESLEIQLSFAVTE